MLTLLIEARASDITSWTGEVQTKLMTWVIPVRFLRTWLPLLAALPILTGLAAYGVLRQVSSVYEATVTLLVQPAAAGAAFDTQAVLAAQTLAQTYAEAIHTRSVLTAAATQIGLASVPEAALESRVTARQVPNTQLVRISVDDTDPEQAARLANAVAEIFLNQNARLENGRFSSTGDNLSRLVERLRTDVDTLTSQVAELNAQPASPERDGQLALLQVNLAQAQVSYADTVKSYQDLQVSAARSTNTASVLDAAVPPTAPVRPNRPLVTLLAVLGGLVGAAAIALGFEYWGDHLRDSRRIASTTGLATLGTVPRSARRRSLREPYDSDLSASHRMLRARLRYTLPDAARFSLLVTSAGRCEGKSTVAANLAIVLAEAGQQVVLIDADLHRPTLGQLFEVPTQRGFCALLADATEPVDAALHSTWVDNLHVLPTGSAPTASSAALSSPRAEAVLDELRRRYDVLVIDSPPVLAEPDAALLSPQVDGVLFVIDANRTCGRPAAAAVDTLRAIGAEVLGAVVNRAPHNAVQYLPQLGSTMEYNSTPEAFSAALDSAGRTNHVGSSIGANSSTRPERPDVA